MEIRDLKLSEWRLGRKVQRRAGFQSDSIAQGWIASKPYKKSSKDPNYYVEIELESDGFRREGDRREYPMVVLDVIPEDSKEDSREDSQEAISA